MTDHAATPPKLHRRSYWVWMNETIPDEDGAVRITDAISVEVTYADQLRGELEIAKQGLNMGTAPMHAATIWVWAAMVRTGRYSDKFVMFKQRDLAELEPITSAGELDALQGEAVPDPT